MQSLKMLQLNFISSTNREERSLKEALDKHWMPHDVWVLDFYEA